MLRPLTALAIVAAATVAAAEPPRLVVLVSVDQLARHRLRPDLPGGLGRLAREGRVFADAALEHGVTETCPGHVTMLTGVHPGAAGIPGNRMFDGARPVHCVADRVAPGESAAAAFQRAGVLGTPEPNDVEQAERVLRSPARLLVDGLGDAPGSRLRVFAVSAKDRAAITLGGRRPALALWLDAAAGFTTSRYYRPSLPPWLVAFDRDRGVAPFRPESFPEAWSYPGDDPRATPDDEPFESQAFGRKSPHPVRAATWSQTFDRILRTPFVDALTLDLARAVVEHEAPGAAGDPAVLAVSLSATDYIGHAYGPDSQEAARGLAELDQQLAGFLRFLEERVGRDRLLVVLTADHGVARIPELAVELGSSECRVQGGRASGPQWRERVARAVGAACRGDGAAPVRWDETYSFKVDPAWWPTCRAPREEALAQAARTLAAEPGVVHVWTHAELGAKDCAGYCRLYANSLAGERSGDLVVQLDPTCELSPDDPEHKAPDVTQHGTPYAYDRDVPLVFWGSGVRPGVVRGRARTVDIAPTLAARLGLAPQPGWAGRALPLE